MPVLIGALALVLAMMWMLGRCSHASGADFAIGNERAGADTVNVAIEMSPLLYMQNGDSVEGLDYEIIKTVAESHKLPVRFYPFVPLKHALDGLESGRYDVVVAALPATSETREKYNMTRGVYTGRQALVQLLDSVGARPEITSQEQLGGKEVWIVERSPYAGRLKNLGDELDDTIIVRSSPEYSAEHLCLLTATGQLPRAVVDEATARRMAQGDPRLDVSVPVSFSQFQSWAVRKEALRDSFDVWLEEFSRTETYDSLLTRYGVR